MQTNRENRIKRLIYQASYTGMKETDILLGGFARQYLPTLTDAELDQFETLLAAGDGNILSWVRGDVLVPDEFDHQLFHSIKRFTVKQ